jgi:hypothetical protein
MLLIAPKPIYCKAGRVIGRRFPEIFEIYRKEEMIGTKKQQETVQMLQSIIDNLEVIVDEYSPSFEDICNGETDSWLVFEGEGVDGPNVGYIKPNGEISWITG